MTNNQEYQYTYIAAGATTNIFAGKGVLHYITINATVASTIKVIDGVAGDTTANVATMKASIAEGTYQYHVSISKGLIIITAGNSDITVCWSKA